MRRSLIATTCLIPVLSFGVDLNVKEGEANINQNGNLITINQHSNNAVYHSNNFDIAAPEEVRFSQPSSNSMALVRIFSPNRTNIYGKLTANGKVVLVNQNGIFFGKTAKVDVNGLIATTIDIDTKQFMNGKAKLEFNKPGSNPNASIENYGVITAGEAGLVGLVAPNVSNHGAIIANGGTVALASGDSFAIDMYGDKLLEVSVSDKLKSQLIQNKGLIQADGGKVIITAAAGKEIVNSLISVEGEIITHTVANKKGEIFIYAEGSNAVKDNIAQDKGLKKGTSKVFVAANIDASGKNAGEAGGKVTITGDEVALLSKTRIDVSGSDGKSGTINGLEPSAKRIGSAGGDVRVGGDYLGKGNDPAAKNLYVDKDATIIADSRNSGDAGRMIFWSDDTTLFYGTASAKAQGKDGNGGFLETSGKKHLDTFSETVPDLTAKNGETGTYLLDPTNIVIYGNVTPKYTSTSSSNIDPSQSINLSSYLKLWLDANNSNNQVTYLAGSATASGTSGDSTITVSDASGLAVGEVINLSSTTPATGALDLNLSDTYVILSISGTTVTLKSNLSSSYSNTPIKSAHVSQWADQSGQGNNASQNIGANMPLLLVNTQNGKSVLNFDGSVDSMNVNLGFIDDPTGNGYNGIAHTSIFTAKTTTYGSFIQQDDSSDSTRKFLEGFTSSSGYAMDYWDNTLASFGGITPSSSFRNGNYNSLTYSWQPDSGSTSNGSNNYKYIYANTNFEGYATAGTIGGYPTPTGTIANTWGGNMAEMAIYAGKLLSDAEFILVNQYESAKWNFPMSPPGVLTSGTATEAQAAMANTLNSAYTQDGYSVFYSGYLARLSQSASISLQAGTDITFDMQGDTLALASGKGFTLSAANILSTGSGGLIQTTNGNIQISATSDLNIPDINMQTTGGSILLEAGTGGSSSASPTFNPNIAADGGVSVKYKGGGISPTNVQFTGINAGDSSNEKVYDATTNVNIQSGFPTTISNSYVTLVGSGATGSTADKNVGTNKPVSLNNLAVQIASSSSAATYTYTAPSVAVTVTPAPLYIDGLTAIPKTYDGSTNIGISGTPSLNSDSSSIHTLGNLYSSDSVSVTGTAFAQLYSAHFNGFYDRPIVTGLSITGTDSANYNAQVYMTPQILVTPALLTVTADNKNMIADTVIPPLTYHYTGLVNNENSVSFIGNLHFAGNASIVGNYSILRGSLAAIGNYKIGSFIPGRLQVEGITSSIPGGHAALSITKLNNIMHSVSPLSNSFGRSIIQSGANIANIGDGNFPVITEPTINSALGTSFGINYNGNNTNNSNS